jgi:hypothetical protein
LSKRTEASANLPPFPSATRQAAIKAKRRPLYSEPMIVRLEGDVKDVKLVLSSPTSYIERQMAQPQKKTPQ